MINTYERKAARKKGVSRLVLVGISIILEFVVLIYLFDRLNRYATWIRLINLLLALVLVLVLYAQPKTSAMKMPWIMLILVAPIMGFALYILIGLNGRTYAMKKRYRNIDAVLMPELHKNNKLLSQLKRGDSARGGVAAYLAEVACFPAYENTEVEFYDEAIKGLEAQIAELKRAERFIFMEYHAIEDSEAWGRLEEVLRERAAAGVEVRVFYDDMGSIFFISKGFIKKLNAAGIQCRAFNPFMPGMNIFLNNRDHRKITVIDGKVGFTGGYNLADEYFNITHPYGMWKDNGIKLTGEAVRSLTVMFLEMWNAVKGNDIDDNDFERFIPRLDYHGKPVNSSEGFVPFCSSSQARGYVQPYADTPLDDEQVGENVYISIIEKAEKYCYIITPYLIITDEMTHALTLAAKRGVDVRIVTPGIPDKKLVYSVTRSFYRGIAKSGVRIYEWAPGFCHAKMCVSDDRVATCGTINLDYRSLYHHFENGCVLYDCPCIAAMKADFETTFKESNEVTQKVRTDLSAALRLGQLVLRLFAELL